MMNQFLETPLGMFGAHHMMVLRYMGDRLSNQRLLQKCSKIFFRNVGTLLWRLGPLFWCLRSGVPWGASKWNGKTIRFFRYSVRIIWEKTTQNILPNLRFVRALSLFLNQYFIISETSG